MLISFEVTVKLICVFVFAYADCWFSHDAAQLMMLVFLYYSSGSHVSLFSGMYFSASS